MPDPLSRREFLARLAAAGVVTILEPVQSRVSEAAKTTVLPAVAVVHGGSAFDATQKAVELLGGLRQFVSRGARVGLLINSRYSKAGTFVNPDIPLAVIALCAESSVGSLLSLEGVADAYWGRTPLSARRRKDLPPLGPPGPPRQVRVSGGLALHELEVCSAFLDCDALINISIVKHHEGVRTTGSLKNIMGATTSATNQFFHFGSHARGYYDDVDFLSQCIADANLLRKPSLSIMDAREFIVTNGPFGPGRTRSPGLVVAGTDPVAVDAFGATLLGLEPLDIQMLRKAREHGIGQCDLRKVAIRRSEL